MGNISDKGAGNPAIAAVGFSKKSMSFSAETVSAAGALLISISSFIGSSPIFARR